MRTRLTTQKVTNSPSSNPNVHPLDGIPADWIQIGKGHSAVWGDYLVYRTGRGKEARVYEGLPGKYVSKEAKLPFEK